MEEITSLRLQKQCLALILITLMCVMVASLHPSEVL